MSNPPPAPQSAKRSRIPWFLRMFIGLGVLFLLALILAVPVANWAGKHAWDKCCRELAARGESLDWKDYIPPPVPDDQNIFKAPHMTNWFVGQRRSELVDLLDSKSLPQFLSMQNPSSIVGDVVFVPLDYNFNQGNVSLLFRYHAPVLSLWTNSAGGPVEPLISVTNTALSQAIDLLAHAANLKFKLDLPLESETNLVTCCWTNASAEQALFGLLGKYNLGWSENPKTGVLLIPGRDRAYADTQTRAAIRKVIQRAQLADANVRSTCLTGPAGLSFVRDEANLTNQAHFVVQTSERPAADELELFFTNAAAGGSNQLSLVTNFSDPQSLSIVTASPCPASDYLNWSEQFEPQFAAIRTALKRPYARRDGRYEPATISPIPNFVAIRNLARTLAQRAQCDLLLGKPDDALRELTLIHDLRHLSDGDLTNRYGSLISAMINAAVSQIYIRVVADGIHLHAWHDSQLLAIQKQLGELNLCALTINGFRNDRAMFESSFEMSGNPWLYRNGQVLSLPRVAGLLKGWIYQNQVTIARMDQKLIDSYDLTNDLIHMDLVNSFKQQQKTLGSHLKTLIAAIETDFSKALSRAAFDQTDANEARIACAIERYRIAHGNLPDTLDALTPQFIEKLPHDIMNGQPLKYHRLSNEQFQLYSIGWNQTDDGGITATNIEQGDWGWPPTK